MPVDPKIVIEILVQYSELPIGRLWRLSEYGNRTVFFKTIDQFENDGIVKSRRKGSERLISLASPNKTVDSFINTFGKRLDSYEKLVSKHLNGFRKNMPLISKKEPMKKIKTKIGIIELDKKRRMYRYMGKTKDSHAYTWKTRSKPRMHFDQLLNTLNRIYQESSAINFAEPITEDSRLIKEYQKRSERLIKETITKIENICRGDGPALNFVIYRIRNVIYGMIFKYTLEKEIKS